jgi:hypothetical protein
MIFHGGVIGANAQVKAGGAIAYKKFLGAFDGATMGLSITAERELLKDFYLTGEIGYDLPVRITSSVFGFGGTSPFGMGPEIVLIPVTFNVNTMHVSAGLKLDLFHLRNDLVFYLSGETGFQMAYVNTKLGEYERNKYTVEVQDDTRMLTAIPVIPGAGFRYDMGPTYFYMAARISAPVARLNPYEAFDAFEVPMLASVSFGLQGFLR